MQARLEQQDAAGKFGEGKRLYGLGLIKARLRTQRDGHRLAAVGDQSGAPTPPFVVHIFWLALSVMPLAVFADP
ncbi:MAG: hypothetical protein IRY98_12725 [Alicyclobacillaceae bacterium]|nr:hypothetical protein [Alicyclobacillaceae bacterium]